MTKIFTEEEKRGAFSGILSDSGIAVEQDFLDGNQFDIDLDQTPQENEVKNLDSKFSEEEQIGAFESILKEFTRVDPTRTGQFSDPAADRIMFFDDSASVMTGLVVSSGLTITTTNLTADAAEKLAFTKKRASGSVDLEDDTKYAVCILKLAGAVTPADYATLKSNIEDVAGVQTISLLVDHQTEDAVQANHTQVLRVRADITLRDDTPPVVE